MKRRIWNEPFIWLALLLIAAFVNDTLADEGHGHNHGGGDVDIDVGGTDVSVGGTDIAIGDTNLTGGDTTVSTGGNKTFAFAYGMGDVDINEGQNCMGSEQWGTVIVGRQTMELNPWCASLFYELNGKHEFAAKMRCDIKEVRKKYATDEECWIDQDLTPPEAAPTVLEEHHEIEAQHDEDLSLVRSQLSEVQMQLAELEERPPQRVVQRAPAPVQQAPADKYSDEQVAAVWAALKGGDEDE